MNNPAAAPEVVENPNPVEEQPKQEVVTSEATEAPAENKETPSEFKLPEAYKDKAWAGKVKSDEDLYKLIDNLDSQVGKKAIIPDLEKATPKEREEYFASIRPKSIDEYKFDDAVTTPELKKAFGEMFLEAGIPAYQGSKIIEKYNAMEAAQKQEMFSEEGFIKVLDTSFGKDRKVIADEADKILKANLSDADYQELEYKIPNQYVGIMYRFAAKIKEQYGINDAGIGGDEDPNGTSPINIKEKQADLRKKITEADAAGKFDEKDRYQAELEATYGIKKK